eukprot:9617259-Alexandrium_andersonii.AAC.1
MRELVRVGLVLALQDDGSDLVEFGAAPPPVSEGLHSLPHHSQTSARSPPRCLAFSPTHTPAPATLRASVAPP